MRLALVGDVMLGRLVNRALIELPPEYPWGDTLPLLHQTDWRLCNLESVISDWGEPWTVTPKVFHFRSDAKNIAVLQAARIDAVSVANNHTLDFEYTAMLDMTKRLEQAGIDYAGAGVNLEEASRLAGIQRYIDGQRIGVFAFTDNEPTWAADHAHPGIWYVPSDVTDPRAVDLFEKVRRARDGVDLLIVSAHWGTNWGDAPPPAHVHFGRALIDAGADIVFGHSCHVVRGIERYKDRLIIYGAGDFIDDYAVDEIERNDRSFVFVVETEGRTILDVELHPTGICDCQARLATGREAEAIGLRMQKLCGDLGSDARWRDDRRCLELHVSSRPVRPVGPHWSAAAELDPPLKPGEQVPHFDVTTIDGQRARYADLWQKRNLVLALIDPARPLDQEQYAANLLTRADDFTRGDTALVVSTEPVFGLPAPGVLVADRWGEVVQIAVSDARPLALPDADDLLAWIDFVRIQCPECPP